MVTRSHRVWQGGDGASALPGWGHRDIPSLSPGDMRALLRHSRSRFSTRAVFAILLMHADRLGVIVVRNADLAEAAGLNVHDARHHLYKLRDMGEIECLRRGTNKIPTMWRIIGAADRAA